MYLSVIIPAYNESVTLRKNVLLFLNYLKSQGFDFEIIIVNDGSSDRTESIAKELSSQYPEITLISKKINQGKGSVIRDGMLTGQGDFLLFLDADNATSINHLDLAWPLLKGGNDLVIGSRNPKDVSGATQKIPQNIFKRITGICGNILIRLISIPNIYDTQCGFKIFTKKSVDSIFPKTKINRWAIDVEILTIARRQNLKVGIIPVVWNCGPISRVGVKGYFVMLWELLVIKINDFKKSYN